VLQTVIDSPLAVAVVLVSFIVSFTIFPWRPITGARPIPWASARPVVLLTLSSLLQVAFIVLVASNVVGLANSFEFAAFGLPICAFSILLARRRKKTVDDLPRGTVVCSIVGFITWMFLVTVH
jgi:hypothetical protein